MLADRGGIDLDAPVRKYWPECAAEGKGDVGPHETDRARSIVGAAYESLEAC